MDRTQHRAPCYKYIFNIIKLPIYKMKLFQICEKLLPSKAGFIPYFRDGKHILYAFQTPSNPRYGGDRPAIAKGGIDPGESPKNAAIREASEELGLKISNLKKHTIVKGWHGELKGDLETYVMSVYAGEIKSIDDFNKPNFESLGTSWMTLNEFKKNGRHAHVHIVETIANIVSAS